MQVSSWKGILMTTGLAVGLFCGGALAQTAGQDMHDAGHDTKAAAADTGHATKKVTKKGYHKTKRGTKKAYHKTTDATKSGWHKTENLGDRVADKPETH